MSLKLNQERISSVQGMVVNAGSSIGVFIDLDKSVKPGDPVTLKESSPAGVVCVKKAGSTDQIFGVLPHHPFGTGYNKSSNRVGSNVYLEGTVMKLEAGEAFEAGQVLKAEIADDTHTKVKKATAGTDKSIGIALEKAKKAGELVSVQLKFDCCCKATA